MGERLFSPRLYEPVLVEFDLAGREMRRYRLPTRPDEAGEDLWAGASLGREAKRAILTRMHVLTALLRVGERLFFLEVHHASNLLAPVLFDPGTASALRFPRLKLLQGNGAFIPGECSFPNILGTDGLSLIALIDDPRLFSECGKEFALLRALKPSVVERPILVFLTPRV